MDRTESQTEIKVYSNQPCVTLLVDGKPAGTQNGDKIFRFPVTLTGEHTIEAVAGDLHDEMVIRKAAHPNPGYVKEGGDLVNWFDRADEIAKEGYFSILDSVAALKACPQAYQVYAEMTAPLQAKAVEAYGDVAKSVKLPESVLRQMDLMSVEATLKQMGKLITPEFVHKLNAALNQIKKD